VRQSQHLQIAKRHDDLVTVAAIAALAFKLADIGHEVVGHSIGFVLAGGHSAVLTTTRLNETQRLGDRGGDIFDLGGPFGNLLFAGLSWLGLRFVPPAARRLRLLLWQVMAFSLFWGFAYLMFCGVFGRGDWFALIRAAANQWIWRIVFVGVGFWLYRVSLKLLTVELQGITCRTRAWRLLLTCYCTGGVIACLGASLDPRGAYAILHDAALSGFGSAIGMLEIPRRLARPVIDDPADAGIERSVGWITAAAAFAVFYICFLGPGIKVAF